MGRVIAVVGVIGAFVVGLVILSTGKKGAAGVGGPPAVAEGSGAVGALPLGAAQIEILFSPNPATEAAVVRALQQAQSQVLVGAMTLTNPAILRALVQLAKPPLDAAGNPSRKPVEVAVMIDLRNADNLKPAVRDLYLAGVKMRTDGAEPIYTNSLVLIDTRTVVIGNVTPFTPNSVSRNAGSVQILRNVPEIAARYRADFMRHWEHSAWVDVKRMLREPVIDPITGERLD